MPITYHIRIKQEYAAAIIEDLRKKDALEMAPENEAFDMPQWQIEEVGNRMQNSKNNPELLIGEDDFFEILNVD